MKGRILVINTGSTSTKIAVYDAGEMMFEKGLTHTAEEIAAYESVMDQTPMRRDAITDFLLEKGVPLHTLDIAMARGGLITPIRTGVYEVTQEMRDALMEAKEGAHACHLSALIADDIAVMVNEARAAEGIEEKCRAFIADPPIAPFVMELPAYHMPSARNVLRSTMERGWDFVKRALTIVLLSSIVLWFLQSYGFEGGVFQAVEDANTSLLAALGNTIAWIFYPLGWMGDMAWKSTVATFTGLIAKEQVVMTFGTLYNFAGELSESGNEIWALVAADFGPVTAYSFMIFQLLCAPCFAAIGAIRREMHSAKWTAITIAYMCGFAYAISMIVYQIGGLLTGEAVFSIFTVVAFAVLALLLYLLLRKGYTPADNEKQRNFAVDHM